MLRWAFAILTKGPIWIIGIGVVLIFVSGVNYGKKKCEGSPQEIADRIVEIKTLENRVTEIQARADSEIEIWRRNFNKLAKQNEYLRTKVPDYVVRCLKHPGLCDRTPR